MSVILSLRDITRSFQNGEAVVHALNGVSLDIHDGEFVAIMGQSGSGKTTLMNIIGCLDRSSSGTYLVRGHDVSSLTADELAALRRDSFGFIFQRYNLLETSTASENVEIPAMYAGMDQSHRRSRAHDILSRLGLGDRTDHRPNQLSGGQQQRVAVARALMNDPPVILADEPTGALDSHSGQEVMDLLKQLHKEGRTIILITHDEQVAAHANRQIRIQDGKVLSDTLSNTDPIHAYHNDHQMKEDHLPSPIQITAGEWTEAIITALRSLKTNKFRTALTLLGIVIGVAAVITMLAVGNGSKQSVLDQISSMGTNLLSVRTGAPGMRRSGDIATLTIEDSKAIEELPNVDVVVPERTGTKTVRYGNTDLQTSIQGEGVNFPRARDWYVVEGTFFSLPDVNSYAPVAVIGKTVKTTFFPMGQSPIGETILIGNVPFEIIGVMDEKGAAPWGQDQDNAVFIPVTTGLVRLFGSNYLDGITVRIADTSIVDQTQQQITDLLKERHKTEDFSVRNTAAFLAMATETQNTLTILLGAVAAISLFVGGIGVMNIMLVSVTERTREIGIRMATGARMRDILIQFNTESAVVCTIGGILGVIVGLATGGILTFFDVKIVFTVGPALLAFFCAIGTGLVFGYLPARKAALLDPVVALSS